MSDVEQNDSSFDTDVSNHVLTKAEEALWTVEEIQSLTKRVSKMAEVFSQTGGNCDWEAITTEINKIDPCEQGDTQPFIKWLQLRCSGGDDGKIECEEVAMQIKKAMSAIISAINDEDISQESEVDTYISSDIAYSSTSSDEISVDGDTQNTYFNHVEQMDNNEIEAEPDSNIKRNSKTPSRFLDNGYDALWSADEYTNIIELSDIECGEIDNINSKSLTATIQQQTQVNENITILPEISTLPPCDVQTNRTGFFDKYLQEAQLASQALKRAQTNSESESSIPVLSSESNDSKFCRYPKRKKKRKVRDLDRYRHNNNIIPAKIISDITKTDIPNSGNILGTSKIKDSSHDNKHLEKLEDNDKDCFTSSKSNLSVLQNLFKDFIGKNASTNLLGRIGEEESVNKENTISLKIENYSSHNEKKMDITNKNGLQSCLDVNGAWNAKITNNCHNNLHNGEEEQKQNNTKVNITEKQNNLQLPNGRDINCESILNEKMQKNLKKLPSKTPTCKISYSTLQQEKLSVQRQKLFLEQEFLKLQNEMHDVQSDIFTSFKDITKCTKIFTRNSTR